MRAANDCHEKYIQYQNWRGYLQNSFWFSEGVCKTNCGEIYSLKLHGEVKYNTRSIINIVLVVYCRVLLMN